VFCIDCGSRMEDSAKFCRECGRAIDGSHSRTSPGGFAPPGVTPSEVGVERCQTKIVEVKKSAVMTSKNQIRAEGWGPNGPYVVDSLAPAIYYTPGSAEGRYKREWTDAVYALFERLSASGWVREREAASGRWWEQVFVRTGPQMVTVADPATWRPDPTGRHQLRYFDGKKWTEHVADSGIQTTDPYNQSQS
jgi:hypothetical protein